MRRPSDRFTLAQAIAWVVWHDPTHPLALARPGDAPLAEHLGLGVVPEGGRVWWEEAREVDQMVQGAIEDIERQISAGNLSVAATLVDEGSPPGHVFDGRHHDPVPTDVTRLRCHSQEWVGTSVGGWLFFREWPSARAPSRSPLLQSHVLAARGEGAMEEACQGNASHSSETFHREPRTVYGR